ncbi:astacin-like metalloendopeptidase [Leptotrombidium deliense]|uniref:Astacin-like metalloendopeptidase n=1 Tax=Leptotrombidium deliense TaxID=299467 RepID=A0A443S433_9ACAR|nr:astacin-like metalloendopeptidase [Leptotrombidium deliense]
MSSRQYDLDPDLPLYIPTLLIPSTAADAYKMQLNDFWYSRGSKRYVTPMFRNNKYVVRYYVLSELKAEAKENIPRLLEKYGFETYDQYQKWLKDVNNNPITVEDIKAQHAEIEANTCLYFYSIANEVEVDEKFFVIVYNFYKYGCEVEYDTVGRLPRSVYINVGTCPQSKKYALTRALMQVLGFILEHRRPDRNSYVNFHFRNAAIGDYWRFLMINYNFAPNVKMNEEPFIYDYYSVMHFRQDEYFKYEVRDTGPGGGRRPGVSKAIPKHVLEPICKIDPKDMGGIELSKRDKQRLQILYSCDKLKPIIDEVILTPEGRNAFYYDAASGYVPWGYRNDITHHHPDQITK